VNAHTVAIVQALMVPVMLTIGVRLAYRFLRISSGVER
jgi:hypothetical protein